MRDNDTSAGLLPCPDCGGPADREQCGHDHAPDCGEPRTRTTETRYALGKGRVGVLRWNEQRERDGFEWAVWEPHPFHGLTRTQVGRSDSIGAVWALVRASGTLEGSLPLLSVTRS